MNQLNALSNRVECYGQIMRTRTTRLLDLTSKALLAVGVVIALIPLFADPLGLGRGPDFLFFQLWHVSRSTMFYAGLILTLTSLFLFLWLKLRPFSPQFVKVWRDFLTAAIAEAAAKPARPPITQFLFLFAGQLTLAAIIAALVFWLNRGDLMAYIDGHYLLTLSRNRADFAAAGLVFSSNPLQGLGDLWYTSANTQWIPELSVMRLFSDPGWQRVAVHFVAFVELFTVVTFVTYWMCPSPGKAFASAWLAVFLIAPLTYPALVYNVQTDNPEFTSVITFPLVIVPMWAGVGRGSLSTDALRIGGIALLFWVHLITIGLATALDYPFLAIVSLVFLAASWPNRAEFWRKIFWGFGLLLFFAISGLPQILLGLIGDSAFHIFTQEMARSGQDLSSVQDLSVGSILLRPSEPIGVGVAILGLAGAACQARFGRGPMHRFAIATLILASLILSASAALELGLSGPAIPIYYEVVLWAVYPIFAVSLLAAAWKLSWSYLSVPMRSFVMPLRKWQWLALPLAGLLVLHGPNYLRGLHNDRPNVFPPMPTAISEFLHNEVGIAPGTQFRGRTATMTGQYLPPKITWDQLFGLDMGLIRALGNEHRTIGLWYYNIPTLTEFTVTTPPLLYALVKRYLAYKDDIQGRHILTMRHADVHVLRLLGVRYAVTDSSIPIPGSRRVIELPLPKGEGKLVIDELPAPNLGISPTEIVSIPDNEALDWLGRKGNDFQRTAILAGPAPGALTMAHDISITIEHGGIRVRAKCTGHSLVVIPFQFSHCLRAMPLDSLRPPELRRADLLLTGILFDGDLDVTIQYRQGPFEAVNCRLYDRHDDIGLLSK